MGINRIIKRVCRFFVAVLVVAIPLKGYAALQHLEPELSWKNVSVDNKKVTVYCVFCDSRGIMWLGTNDGLYFYTSDHYASFTELTVDRGAVIWND